MGKTYRKEQQYRKSREESAAHKAVDHNHERTASRRALQEVKHHWDEEDDVENGVED